jgi:hypothetical protein
MCICVKDKPTKPCYTGWKIMFRDEDKRLYPIWANNIGISAFPEKEWIEHWYANSPPIPTGFYFISSRAATKKVIRSFDEFGTFARYRSRAVVARVKAKNLIATGRSSLCALTKTKNITSVEAKSFFIEEVYTLEEFMKGRG